jgi:radical SAM protein with 4Fe4S-binding SPASM domain
MFNSVHGAARLRILADFARYSLSYARGRGAAIAGLPLPDSPVALLVGPTNRCNLRCDFCFQSDNDVPPDRRRPKRMMPFERFEAIVAQAASWVTYLEFGLFGEPTLHPRIGDMVEAAARSGLAVGLDTNATLLDAALAERLVDAGLTTISISIEGATPEEFERLRVGASWDTVTANLRRLVELRRGRGRRAPLVVVRGIALRGMEGARAAHAARFRAMGADLVLWVPAHDWSGSLVSRKDTVPPAASAVTHLCEYPWLLVGIDWDGTVVPCCVDFNAKNVIGNIDATPLRELWHGGTMTSLRKALRSRDPRRIEETTGCAGCSMLAAPTLSRGTKAQLVRQAMMELRARVADG